MAAVGGRSKRGGNTYYGGEHTVKLLRVETVDGAAGNLWPPSLSLKAPWTLHQKFKETGRRSNVGGNIDEVLTGKTVDGAVEKDQLSTGTLKLLPPFISNSNTWINTGTF